MTRECPVLKTDVSCNKSDTVEERPTLCTGEKGLEKSDKVISKERRDP